MKNPELKEKWDRVVRETSDRFGGGEELDLDAIVFLIGIQELGKGYQRLKKDQKVDVMHIAICRLLSNYGYYEYKGVDDEGWPHWEAKENLPYLKAGEQSLLMKEAIVQYFEESGLFSNQP